MYLFMLFSMFLFLMIGLNVNVWASKIKPLARQDSYRAVNTLSPSPPGVD